jgi:hypothetical protein
MRALQLDAYRRGSEIKRAHEQARCVLRGAELLALAGDYAHLLLFKELQHPWGMTNLYERAGLRIRAFWCGYEDGPRDAFEKALRVGLPGMPRRMKRRRGTHRLSVPRGT